MSLIKRLFAAVICILMIISCVTTAFAEDSSVDDTAADTVDYVEDESDETASTGDEQIKVPPEASPASTVLGDMDSDYIATIDDAYYLRLHYAGIITLGSKAIARSDANLDGSYSVVDASFIQAALAQLRGNYYVGMDVTQAKRKKADDDILDRIDNFTSSKGVDISEHNGSVDMKKLKAAGYSFVMIRLGWGDDYVSQDDQMFETNVRNAEAAGLDWGAYIYSYALNVNQVKNEVQHTLRLLKGKKPTMPIAFDWEEDDYKESKGYPTDAVLRDICRTYLSGIQEAGYYPMLYTGYDLLKGALNHPSIIDTYDIWYAQWSSTCDYKDRPIGMWQYGGSVNFLEEPTITGLSGEFDKNFAYKNYPMIMKAYGWNNHTALLQEGIASTSAEPYFDPSSGREDLPADLNGRMGDSMR